MHGVSVSTAYYQLHDRYQHRNKQQSKDDPGRNKDASAALFEVSLPVAAALNAKRRRENATDDLPGFESRLLLGMLVRVCFMFVLGHAQ